MSKEYVLASDVVAVLKTMHEEGYCLGNNNAMLRIFEKLANLKMVEAEPVVHARWEWKDLHGDGSLTLCCSNCLETDGARETAKRCPECGAHMDEEVADV